MTDTPGFSLVLPSLNEGSRLAETIQSGLDTCGNNSLEIIAVDDMSDDFSGQDARDMFADDNRVKVVFNERRLGVAGARHAGALASTGKTLIFVDAHSRFPDGWLDDIDAAMEMGGRQCLYGTALLPMDGQEYAAVAHGVWYDTSDLSEHYTPARLHTDRPYHVMGLPGGSMIADRGFYLNTLGGFDPGLMPPWGQENMELCMRSWLLGYQCRIIPSVVIETHYKESDEANPGIKAKNMLYNKLRIAALYMTRERFEKVGNDLRHQDYFAEAVAILLYDRMGALYERAIEWQIEPDDLFEKFGIQW
ncbi:MAG: glycosyltransferase [Chloroflexi bacterium]|nr:glycosyltransferase [Chloroflexota bacterium]